MVGSGIGEGRRNSRSACLKTDDRTIEAAAWPAWLTRIASTRSAFANFIDHDPLSNETSSVSVLATAAARCGLLSMTEYVCGKHHPDRRRILRRGRADLWVGSVTHKRTWGFEAKQINCRPGTRHDSLVRAMDAARTDAWKLPDTEADKFFGILIATLPKEHDVSALDDRLEEFAAREAQFAWRIGGGAKPAYIFFSEA